MTASYGQLKAAQAKFRTCIESVNAIKPENANKEILVPLTSSLHVPGTIADTSKVIVDVGTGYYVEKSTEDARTMYQGRVEYVSKSLEQLQETITRKEDNMRVVRDILMVVSLVCIMQQGRTSIEHLIFPLENATATRGD